MPIVLSESPPVCEANHHRIAIVSFVKFHVWILSKIYQQITILCKIGPKQALHFNTYIYYLCEFL